MEDIVYEELTHHFEGAFGALRRDLARLRSGQANVNLLDNIRVTYYGVPTPLNQMAAVQVPEPRMITIKPFDATQIKEIERAILQSDLGLNPNNDGKLIRLSIPPLTEERRKTLVRQAKEHGENAKVAARNSRRDAISTLKKFEADKELSQDQLHRAMDHVQKLTDEATNKIDEIVRVKEAELMEV
ncbi:MAG: ribosome recycling factor [Myxococcales bacterium]|nr:ribosome recycling factor [Myxococcales bacterium]